MQVHRDYAPRAIYITENGCAYEDTLTAEGQVHDDKRTDYLRAHLPPRTRRSPVFLSRAISVWSLMDNFEWAYGYSRWFGIVYVDFDSQERYPKDSAPVLPVGSRGQRHRTPMTHRSKHMKREELKERVCSAIDARRDVIIAAAEDIRTHPELGYKEFRTAGIVSDHFSRLGIDHESGLAITGVKGRLAGRERALTVAYMGELDSIIVPDHPDADPETGAAHAGTTLRLPTCSALPIGQKAGSCPS